MHSVAETHQSRTTAQHNAGTTWASDGVQVEIIRRLPHQRELREELHGLEEQFKLRLLLLQLLAWGCA